MTITALPPATLTTAPATDWVPAAPFRAWVCQLVSDTGQPWRVIARAARVPSTSVLSLLRGRDGRPTRQLRRRDAQALLAVDHSLIAAHAGEPASADLLRLLAWALMVRGCRPELLCEFIGLDARAARTLLAGSPIWCSRLHLLRAEAACEAWGIDPDELRQAHAAGQRRSA